jgi:hypothetical protein
VNSNTIGIQNATQDDGLTVVYNDYYVEEGLAVAFQSIPEWLMLAPTSGVIPAGGCATVIATLDGTEIAEGIHEATIELMSNDPATPSFSVPVTADVNLAPVALCADAVVDTGPEDCVAHASIDAGSYDPDGGPVTRSQSPASPYPLGDTLVTLTVTDETGLTDTCQATVTVVDTTPPEIEVYLTPDILWAPNHEMVDIEAIVPATDNCGDPWVSLVDVTSSEDDNGLGDGNTTDDIQGAEYGTPDFNFQLRAERSALGEGRFYTVSYVAMDSSGNMTQAEAIVVVPHDRGRDTGRHSRSTVQYERGEVDRKADEIRIETPVGPQDIRRRRR